METFIPALFVFPYLALLGITNLRLSSKLRLIKQFANVNLVILEPVK